VRKGGHHVIQKTKTPINLSMDLSYHMMSPITTSWSQFWTKDLQIYLHEFAEQLVKNIDVNIHQKMNEKLKRDIDYTISFATFNTSLLHHCKERVVDTLDRIKNKYRKINFIIPTFISEQLAQAFKEAAKMKGKGLLKRMVEYLITYCKEHPEIFRNANQTLIDEMDSVFQLLGVELEALWLRLLKLVKERYQSIWTIDETMETANKEKLLGIIEKYDV